VQDVVAALPGLTIQRAEQALRPVLTGDGERAAIGAVVRARRRQPSLRLGRSGNTPVGIIP
jgi:hypothetical protein